MRAKLTRALSRSLAPGLRCKREARLPWAASPRTRSGHRLQAGARLWVLHTPGKSCPDPGSRTWALLRGVWAMEEGASRWDPLRSR